MALDYGMKWNIPRHLRELGCRVTVVPGTASADDKELGSLRALSGVARFPARVKCALLAWNALESALNARAS